MRFPVKIRPLLSVAIFLGFLALKAAATTYYVDVNSTNPAPPYTNWSTASTDIQSAIDVSTNGDLILVNPGVYQTGGRTVNGFALTNRVVIDQAITVQSVGGPAETVIEGYQVPGTTNGPSAVRCVYMTNNAVLIGFTLTNGATMGAFADEDHAASGGGVWCEDNSAIVSNCVLSANTADFKYGVGGGALEGTLNNCTLIGNLSAGGGGAYASVLNNCTLTDNLSIQGSESEGPGGGAFSCTLNQCVLAGNLAGYGGGAESSVLNNCVVTNNSAGDGGGVGQCTVNNCVISGNTAGSGSGGGTWESSLTNCTLTGNSAYNGGASDADVLDGCILSSNSASVAGGATYSSILTDCTVMDNSSGGPGGGADGGTIYNCVLYGNIAFGTGGGVNSATIENSAIFGNFAVGDGGGAAGSKLASCTLTGNSATSGGGAYSSSLTNCIIYYNEAPTAANYDAGSSLEYSCTTPLPANGSGNIADAPDLADDFHLGADSPCIGAGNPGYVTGVDIDGNPWANPPAIGCDDFDPSMATGPLTVAIEATFTNLATGFTGGFTAQINGHAAICLWNFGDGTEVANQPNVSHAWTTAGAYQVSLWAYNESNPAGASATITVQVTNEPVQYVALENSTPVAPYLSWATAATNIQDAVDAAFGGGVILVSNGVYQSGGNLYSGRIWGAAVTRAITLQSVSGPATTLICGSNFMSCIYLANGAMLSGFTLTNGLFNSLSLVGGGAYCASTSTVITNCVLINNSAAQGGGAYSGTLINCTLQGNGCYKDVAGGGGAAYSTLLNCAILQNQGIASGYYGGAYQCTLSNCVVAGNSRGGVGYSTLDNCTIENNTGIGDIELIAAGGATQSTLNNCLVCGNQIMGTSGGGGAYDCVLNFCVISNNTATYFGGGVYYDSKQTSALGQSNIVIGNIVKYGVYPQGGGGVDLDNANFNLAGWTFISNSAAGNGGGLFLSYLASASNCTFIGNFAGGNGGGCYYETPTSATPVSDCTFMGNVAVGDGGGAYAYLTNCSVIGNKAGYGGGVYGAANDCVVNSNVATTNGGGLYLDIGQPVFNCSFTNNSALNGGGAYAPNNNLSFSNCVFWANSATNDGGGVEFIIRGSLADCIIGNNDARLNGGGVYEGSLSYCIVSGNVAGSDGGGAYDSLVTNCLLTGNSAAYGGGAFGANIILDSTIAYNQAADNGGGIYSSKAVNSIIYDNSAPTNMNYAPTNNVYSHCCIVPLPFVARGASNSNFTNDPAFVDPAAGNFRLQSDSPCINSGNNASVEGSTDLDGNPRIVGGTVDIGAYEYQTPVSMVSYEWLEQYGLPITTNTDTSHPNGTSFDVYQDWIAGLNPTNPASVLVMLPPPPTNNASGITVSWESVSGIDYNLLRTTSLTSTFTTIHSNIVGQAGTTSYSDTTATNSGPYFYQVAVP